MDAEKKCTIIRCTIVGIVLLAMFVYVVTIAKALHEQEEQIQIAQAKYVSKMESCLREGYSFVVDVTRIEKASDDFPSTSFGKYNVTYDDAGKQVIMTTLQPAPRSHSSTPIFLFAIGGILCRVTLVVLQKRQYLFLY